MRGVVLRNGDNVLAAHCKQSICFSDCLFTTGGAPLPFSLPALLLLARWLLPVCACPVPTRSELGMGMDMDMGAAATFTARQASTFLWEGAPVRRTDTRHSRSHRVAPPKPRVQRHDGGHIARSPVQHLSDSFHLRNVIIHHHSIGSRKRTKARPRRLLTHSIPFGYDSS